MNELSKSLPTAPGWYECRLLRNPQNWLIVRWWSGRALYHTRREADAVDTREYTDFIGPLVPASRDEGRELAIQLIDNWLWNLDRGTANCEVGGQRVGLEKIRAALSPPPSTPEERSVENG